jgi:adenosylmethionine-8-amino-7-oxononanoate aminotransferase
LKKESSYLWHPFDVLEIPEEIVITSGEGVYIHTQDGRKILDAISSWWVNLHGHNHPVINQALKDQVDKLEHVIFSGFTHQPAIELSEKLIRILPGNMSKIFLSDDGSTAVEVAIKMALQYWHNQGIPRKKIVAIEGAYHGDTFGAMSVGARSAFNAPFNSLLFDVEFIDFPENEISVTQLETLLQANDVAAFIYEPLIQGAGGMRIYSSDILQALIQTAKSFNVLCIADEVMTGFGRTGKNFASEHCTVFPDIICMSKGLTGGYMPLGATSCTAEVYAPFESSNVYKLFFHGHSYTGNPLACAVANASTDLLVSDQCKTQRDQIANWYILAKELLKNAKNVENVRSIGTILAVDISNNNSKGYFNETRNALYTEFLKRDILLRPLGNTVYLLPPYVISPSELAKVISAIIEVAELV